MHPCSYFYNVLRYLTWNMFEESMSFDYTRPSDFDLKAYSYLSLEANAWLWQKG